MADGPLVTAVLAHELLYRSVRDRPDHFPSAVGPNFRIGTSAFNDREREVSVNRAELRTDGPAGSRLNADDGIVGLTVGEVRSIANVQQLDVKGHLVQQYLIDVRHDPLNQNYSHALVIAAPSIPKGRPWERLKEALAVIAEHRGWLYPPASLRTPTP